MNTRHGKERMMGHTARRARRTVAERIRGVKGLLLVLVTLAEGWCLSYVLTHDVFQVSQLSITAHFLLAVFLPVVWLGLLADGRED